MMKRWWLLLLLAGSACGSKTTPNDKIGEACATGNECLSKGRSACITAWPAGYCTEIDCTLGSCPDGSRCVSGIEFPDVQVDAICLLNCELPRDCRSDGYTCRADPAGAICVPSI